MSDFVNITRNNNDIISTYTNNQNDEGGDEGVASLVAQLAQNTSRMKNIYIDVKADYGAKGDGVTDDSQAFINAIAYAESKSIADAAGLSNNRGQVVIYIPPGSYLITQSEALMRSSFTTRTKGLVIKGAGKWVTEILFHPTTTNSYLLNNNDAWLHIDISDISFTCNDSTSNFMKSVSQGGAQNYTFERCVFDGSWNYGFYLDGGNTNSEMTWFHCNFNGSWNTGVYVPATGSDQFLNYNFYSCQFEVSQGDFLNFQKGGNINIWGGSYIHYGSTAGTFFKLYGNSHAYGVQRFLCIGARMEHRNTNSKLIYCEWNDGTVAFVSVDTSSQTQITGAATLAIATFNSINQKMPNIKFDNCSLMGQHVFNQGSNSWATPHNVKYENCEMTNAQKPSDFIVYTGNVNYGGQPPIKFENCRGISNDQTVIWDTVFNFQKSNRAVTKKKILNIKNGNGQLPLATDSIESFTLPLNSIVTNIFMFSPSGAVSSGANVTFKVQTTEATPTVLGTVSANPYSAGFNYNNQQFFVCSTDQKRMLQLIVTGADQYNGSGMVLVEYI